MCRAKKSYYARNKDTVIKKVIQWQRLHRERRNHNTRKWMLERRKNDVSFKLRKYLSTRICLAIGKSWCSKSTMDLIGCSLEHLKIHLANQFQPGMSWSNYGQWHVDHRRPCASFDLSVAVQQKKCFHYTNLQPLWAKDNLIKGSKT